MKVFVYNKKDSKKVSVLDNIVNVYSSEEKKKIILIPKGGEGNFVFNTREVKLTIYQN